MAKRPFNLRTHLGKFIAKDDSRPLFRCVHYTGEQAVVTNTHCMLIVPSKVPAMNQHFVTGELIEGKFPDYEKVIPKQFEYTALLSSSTARELSRAMKQAALFWKEVGAEYAIVRMSFTKGAIVVHYSHFDVVVLHTIKDKTIKGEFGISVNANYMRDFLACAAAVDYSEMAEIKAEFAGKLKPAIFTMKDFRFIITPVRSFDD